MFIGFSCRSLDVTADAADGEVPNSARRICSARTSSAPVGRASSAGCSCDGTRPGRAASRVAAVRNHRSCRPRAGFDDLRVAIGAARHLSRPLAVPHLLRRFIEIAELQRAYRHDEAKQAEATEVVCGID